MKYIVSTLVIFLVSIQITNANLIEKTKTVHLGADEKVFNGLLPQTNNFFNSDLSSQDTSLEIEKKERKMKITIDDSSMEEHKTEIDRNYIPKTTEIIDSFVKKIGTEKFVSLLKNNTIKIFGSENSCTNRKNINQFGYSFLDYQKCFFEAKEQLETNSYNTLKYIISSEKDGNFSFNYYPFYEDENIYLWGGENLGKKSKSVALTFLDSSLEPQNLKINYFENTQNKKTVTSIKKYELIKFEKDGKKVFVLLPYYKFTLPVKKGKNHVFISFQKYISKKYGKFGEEYMGIKEYY